MRYKVVGEILEPMRLVDFGRDDLQSNTICIILCMEDGSVVEYDLTNPKLPLPSCRALVPISGPISL